MDINFNSKQMKPLKLTYRIHFYPAGAKTERFEDLRCRSVELALRQLAQLWPGATVVKVERYFGPRKL